MKDAGGKVHSYNYHANVAWAVGMGTWEWLDNVIFDGAEAFAGHLIRGTGGGDHWNVVNVPVEGKWLAKGGYLHFWWGTDTQGTATPHPPTTAISYGDPHLYFRYKEIEGPQPAIWHSPYRGTAYLVGYKLLFGREKSSPPNLEVIGGRKPVPVAGSCATEHNVEFEGRINPVAAMSELIGSSRVLNRPDLLDLTSWAAAAQWAWENKERVFCSVLLDNSGDIRATLRTLAEMIHGLFHWTKAGKLALRVVELGVKPADTAKLIDQFQLLGPAKMAFDGWRSVATSVRARYPDKDRKFKETLSSRLDNQLARAIGLTPNDLVLSLPHTTTALGANTIASDRLKMQQQPSAKFGARVRRTLARALEPGDRVWVDSDPDPAGDGLKQAGVVSEVSIDAGSGPGEVEVMIDHTVDPTGYTPNHGPLDAQVAPIASLQNGIAVALPTVSFGEPVGVGILTARTAANLTGFKVGFGKDHAGPYAKLGNQPGFALRLSGPGAEVLDDEDDGEVLATMADGVDAPEGYFLTRVPANGLEARLDELVLVIVKTAASTSTGLPVASCVLTFQGTNEDGSTKNALVSDAVGVTDTEVVPYSDDGVWYLNIGPIAEEDQTKPLWLAYSSDDGVTLELSAKIFGETGTLLRLVSDPAVPPDGAEVSLEVWQGATVVQDSGMVAIGSDGRPLMEMGSIITAVVDSANAAKWNLTFLRARLGTRARTWDWSDPSVKLWLVPKLNIVAWRHPDFRDLMVNSLVGYFSLSSYATTGETERALVVPFKVPGGYNPNPIITWNAPTADPINIPSATAIPFDIDVFDGGGDLVAVQVSVTAKDGTTSEIIADRRVSARTSVNLQISHSFAAGSYVVTVTATDATGLTTTDSKTAVRLGAGDLFPVTFNPPSGFLFDEQVVVTLTAIAPATGLEYGFGSDPPTSVTAVVGLTYDVTIRRQTRKLWARSTQGAVKSEWSAAIYTFSGDDHPPDGQNPR